MLRPVYALHFDPGNFVLDDDLECLVRSKAPHAQGWHPSASLFLCREGPHTCSPVGGKQHLLSLAVEAHMMREELEVKAGSEASGLALL